MTKTYLGFLLLGTWLASACSEDPRRRRNDDDAGEGGEGDTSAGRGGNAAGGAPRGGSSGASTTAGSGGSSGLPSTGGTGGDPGAGGSGNTGATNPGTGGDANPPTGGTSSSDGGTGNVGGGSGATGPVAGTGAGGSGDAGSGSSSGGSSAGTGGTDPCGCTASEACDQNEACVARVAIDDFVACDEEIPEIEGRSGFWGSFSSELITYEADFGDPGSSWVDHSCAAWMIGGGEATTSDYAGLFVILNADGTEGGGPYSLEGYSGIHIEIESTHQLVLQLRTVGDGYFGIVLTPDGDVTSYDIPFLYLSALDHSELAVPDWGQVTQIQVTVVPDAITDFAFAIHYVGVY